MELSQNLLRFIVTVFCIIFPVALMILNKIKVVNLTNKFTLILSVLIVPIALAYFITLCAMPSSVVTVILSGISVISLAVFLIYVFVLIFYNIDCQKS